MSHEEEKDMLSRRMKPQQKGTTKRSVYRSPHALSGQGNKSFGTARDRKRSME
jgi:hypothetical protein